MKAKYFSSTSIIHAKIRYNPSLIWRSIHGAIALVNKLMLWRIGDGSTTKIWLDKWIPKLSSFQVQSPIFLFPKEATIKELIDANTFTWKKDPVFQLFWKEETDLILSLPMSMCGAKDKLTWWLARNGIFSVKSAYFLKNLRRRNSRSEPSNSSTSNQLWKKQWKLKVPSSVQHFVWRICHDILPTKSNLKRRNIINQAICPICEHEEETSIHILWKCPSASDVWSENGSPLR